MWRSSPVVLLLALAACTHAPDESPYPGGPYGIALGETLPDLSFSGVSEDGRLTEITLADYHTPERDGLLVVMVSGGEWCGTCRWMTTDAAHPSTDRVARLDLVLGDRDNAPADALVARAWQERSGDQPIAVGADPEHRLAALFGEGGAALPLAVIVDARAMTPIEALSNPAPEELAYRVDAALAERAGAALPALPTEELVDGLFRPHEWRLLQETTVPGPPPPDLTNAAADDPAAVALGETLFFDTGLSPSGEVSCATCHRTDWQLADGLPRAEGQAEGARRTPGIALAAHGRWQTWDGAADSLWAQALLPFENPAEYDASRAFVARRILEEHREAYRAAFPHAPLPDVAAWPEHGKPGDPAYDALGVETRDAITEVFVNAGKAIAAFERTWRVAPNPLDAYLAGELDALDPEQKYGLQLFVRHGCTQCHWGPRLTDDAFHNVGLPQNERDEGRSSGLLAWQSSDFTRGGRWSDDPAPRAAVEPGARTTGQFKTPALRGVAHAAFFGHGGSLGDLSEVTEAYGWGGFDESVSHPGTREPWLPNFGETVQWGLLPFLEILTAEPILE